MPNGIASEWSHCKSITVDDSRLLVDVPSDYPKQIMSVDPRGVQLEMGLTARWPLRVGEVL